MRNESETNGWTMMQSDESRDATERVWVRASMAAKGSRGTQWAAEQQEKVEGVVRRRTNRPEERHRGRIDCLEQGLPRSVLGGWVLALKGRQNVSLGFQEALRHVTNP